MKRQRLGQLRVLGADLAAQQLLQLAVATDQPLDPFVETAAFRVEILFQLRVDAFMDVVCVGGQLVIDRSQQIGRLTLNQVGIQPPGRDLQGGDADLQRRQGDTAPAVGGHRCAQGASITSRSSISSRRQ